MTSSTIRWDQKQDEEALTATMIVTCMPEGQIHLETPPSQGDFAADYNSSQEAMQGLVGLMEQGIQEAKSRF